MLNMQVIKWQEVESWSMIKRKNNVFLELKGGRPAFHLYIKIPHGYREDLYRLLLRMIPDKVVSPPFAR
jgi:hypothetical protein